MCSTVLAALLLRSTMGIRWQPDAKTAGAAEFSWMTPQDVRLETNLLQSRVQHRWAQDPYQEFYEREPLNDNQLIDAENGKMFRPMMAKLFHQGWSSVIYFIGDSTMRNQFLAFCSVLTGEAVTKVDPYDYYTTFVCKAGGHSAVFEWASIFNYTVVDGLLRRGYPTPTVVYVNNGLWILHMEPSWSWTTVDGYRAWENYEADLQQTLQGYRQAAPQASIVFMNTHSVCEEAYGGDYKRILALYRSNRSVAAEPCVKRLSSMGYFHDDAEEKCVKGFRVDANAQLLNVRLQNTLGKLQNVKVVDAHGITRQRCDCSPDGIHYNALVLEELKHLFVQLHWTSM